MVERAFDGRSVQYDIRCDAPETRRCAQVSISPTGLIKSCSWYNRIRTARGEWNEIEDAIKRLHFFELECVLAITHAICPDCSALMTALYDWRAVLRHNSTVNRHLTEICGILNKGLGFKLR